MSEKIKSTTKKSSTKATEKPAVKKSISAAAPENKRKRTASPRKKEKPVTSQQAPEDVSSTQDLVARAAYLNWCGRRNQGLPDDAFADWISAVTLTNLAN